MAGEPGSGVIASGDFTNIATNNAADGVYTLNGVPCAIGDIIDLAHPETNFDPVQDIDADGIKPREITEGNFQGRSLEMKDPLLATLLDGFTLVVEAYWEDTGDLQAYFHDDDFNIPASFNVSAANNSTNVVGYDGSTAYGSSTNYPPENQISKMAMTVTDARVAVSFNGDPVEAGEEPVLGVGIENIMLVISGAADARLRSFAFYEVVDDADLPTLSAL